MKQNTLPKKKISIFKILELVKHKKRHSREQKNRKIKA